MILTQNEQEVIDALIDACPNATHMEIHKSADSSLRYITLTERDEMGIISDCSLILDDDELFSSFEENKEIALF